MTAFQMTIEKVINEKTSLPTKEEAATILRRIGVFNSNNEVKPEFKDILIVRSNSAKHE